MPRFFVIPRPLCTYGCYTANRIIGQLSYLHKVQDQRPFSTELFVYNFFSAVNLRSNYFSSLFHFCPTIYFLCQKRACWCPRVPIFLQRIFAVSHVEAFVLLFVNFICRSQTTKINGSNHQFVLKTTYLQTYASNICNTDTWNSFSFSY